MVSERFQRWMERLLDGSDEAISQFEWEKVRQCARAVLAIDLEMPDCIEYLATAARVLAGSTVHPLLGQPEPSVSTTTPVASPSEPSCFANGLHQIKRFLDYGGKKNVYLFHDTTLAWEVAFVLIIFDLGQEGNQHYLVTELMGRGGVEGMIENAENQRLPRWRAIKHAPETWLGMEFAHSRSI